MAGDARDLRWQANARTTRRGPAGLGRRIRPGGGAARTHAEEERSELEAARTWARKRFDAGFGWMTGPVEYGGRGLARSYQRPTTHSSRCFATPPHDCLWHRPRDGRTDHPGARHRRGEGALPTGHVARRHRRLPALLRARGGKRPCRPRDQGRPRRGRVGGQRPEGLDLGSAPLGHRRDHLPNRSRRAQAQGAHRLRGRHARPRGRGATAAPDDWWRLVQRGLLHRRPDPRLAPARRCERRMDRGAHHPHERARRHRWRDGDGQRAHGYEPADRAGPASRTGPRPARCDSRWPRS